MRFAIILAATALLTFHAEAQTAPAPAAGTTAAPAVAPPAASSPAPTRRGRPARMPLKKRFDAANTTADGHLTKDQATAANWTYVTSHFEAIDIARKGYVTTDDIRAYSRAARAARNAGATQATAPAPTKP